MANDKPFLVFNPDEVLYPIANIKEFEIEK